MRGGHGLVPPPRPAVPRQHCEWFEALAIAARAGNGGVKAAARGARNGGAGSGAERRCASRVPGRTLLQAAGGLGSLGQVAMSGLIKGRRRATRSLRSFLGRSAAAPVLDRPVLDPLSRQSKSRSRGSRRARNEQRARRSGQGRPRGEARARPLRTTQTKQAARTEHGARVPGRRGSRTSTASPCWPGRRSASCSTTGGQPNGRDRGASPPGAGAARAWSASGSARAIPGRGAGRARGAARHRRGRSPPTPTSPRANAESTSSSAISMSARAPNGPCSIGPWRRGRARMKAHRSSPGSTRGFRAPQLCPAGSRPGWSSARARQPARRSVRDRCAAGRPCSPRSRRSTSGGGPDPARAAGDGAAGRQGRRPADARPGRGRRRFRRARGRLARPADRRRRRDRGGGLGPAFRGGAQADEPGRSVARASDRNPGDRRPADPRPGPAHRHLRGERSRQDQPDGAARHPGRMRPRRAVPGRRARPRGRSDLADALRPRGLAPLHPGRRHLRRKRRSCAADR